MTARADRRLSADDIADCVKTFEAQYGRASLTLAAHAAVAHRLRPEIVAVIRTNFLPNPARFQAAYDADVLFGPLCTFQGDGFFEMQRDIKDFLVDLLDHLYPMSPVGRFRSQDVARLLRHLLRSIEVNPRYATHRYDQFRYENLWRAIAIDDPEAARDQIHAHARRRNETARDNLTSAPRGAGIVSVAGSFLGLYQDDMAYLVAQDLIADGLAEDGVALLELLVNTGADSHAEPRLAPSQLLAEERTFLTRRRNMIGEMELGSTSNEAKAFSTGATKTFANDLTVDSKRLNLRDTALTKAALAGDSDALEDALADPAVDYDRLDRFGLSALHHAVRQGHPEMAMRLLEAGADINVKSAYDANPMFFVGEHGLVNLARTFLDRGANLLQYTAKKSTTLMNACYYGHRDLVALYLSRPEITPKFLDSQNDEGFSALYGPLSVGDPVLYDMLIHAGATPTEPMEEGYTHLHAAAAGRSPELVERILKAGYKVDPLTVDGWSPLHIACSNTPSLEVVLLLLDCGADPYRQTIHGWTPSRIAAAWDNIDIMLALLDLGAPLTRQHFYDAANNGATTVLEYLLTMGKVRVRARDLVDSIIRSGKAVAIEYMLGHPEIFGAKRNDVFAKAVEFGKDEIITLFRDRGWDLPAPIEQPAKKAGDLATVSNPWVNAISKTTIGWSKTMTALLDWPEAHALAAEFIFEKSVEKGKASIIRLFHDHAWPLPQAERPGKADAGPQAATQIGWLAALDKTQTGWRNTMEALLAWPEARKMVGADLFEKAVVRGHLDVFELFEVNGWEAPARPAQLPGWAWVIEKQHKNRDELILSLLDRPDTVVETDAGDRLMVVAAEGGLVRTLAALIDREGAIDAKDTRNLTALAAAVGNGSVAVVQMLLQAGANPNTITGLHQEPVFFHALREHMPALMAEGADLHRRGLNGSTWLHTIAPMLGQPGSKDALQLALEHELDINAADVAGRTPLHLVVERGLTSPIQLLVQAGADIEARNNSGLTPLLLATARGSEEAVEALLAAGANPAARTPGGLSLLHIAAERNRPELLTRFWSQLGGETVMSVTPSRTVLQIAAEAWAEKSVEALIELKVDLNRAAGSTAPPVLLAINARAFDVAKLLLDAGAAKTVSDPVTASTVLGQVIAQRHAYVMAEVTIPPALEEMYLLLRAEQDERRKNQPP